MKMNPIYEYIRNIGHPELVEGLSMTPTYDFCLYFLELSTKLIAIIQSLKTSLTNMVFIESITDHKSLFTKNIYPSRNTL